MRVRVNQCFSLSGFGGASPFWGRGEPSCAEAYHGIETENMNKHFNSSSPKYKFQNHITNKLSVGNVEFPLSQQQILNNLNPIISCA